MLVFDWNGPSQKVQSVAAAVMAQGIILRLLPPAPNASWHMSFPGPALRCNEAEHEQRHRILNSTGTYFGQNTGVCHSRPIPYISWFQDMPYTQTSVDDPYLNTSERTLTDTPGGNATFSIAIFPAMLNYHEPCTSAGVDLFSGATNGPLTDFGIVEDSSSIVQCQLIITKYEVDFKYTNGIQSIVTQTPPFPSDMPFHTFQTRGQRALIELGSFDYTHEDETDCFIFADVISEDGPCSASHAEILSSMSYQAMMEAFSDLFHGMWWLTIHPSWSLTAVYSAQLVCRLES
jgi:hypothetical protein